MSEQQIAELYEKLVEGKFRAEKLGADYPFHRGWNAALDYAIKHMGQVCDEQPDQPAREAAQA